MKILFYISTICNGGAARVMTNVANDLSLKGHDCILATTFRADEEYALAGMVKRVSLYDEKPSGSWLIKNYKIVRKLRELVIISQPDILVSFLAEPCFRAAIATIRTNTKTVLSVRNDPKWEFKGWGRALLAKYLFRRVDGIVFQTEDAKSWFPKCIQKKGRIIFNAVKSDFYNVILPEKKSGIVATGRLSRQKNHALLIKAFARIADSISDNLTIYGAGDPTHLCELANNLGVGDRVFLPGQTMDVINSIKNAKLYVMSSDFEGMPNALMEAMAMGLPCISTDCPCGGPRSLFKSSMYHFLTPVNDVDTLSDRMLELLQNDEIRMAHGKQCKEAAYDFTPEVINREWEDYLNSVNKH